MKVREKQEAQIARNNSSPTRNKEINYKEGISGQNFRNLNKRDW